MTRIIAGFAGSRELKVPASGTRPTSDRVREAMFSSLDAIDVIRGSRVLDLYAGSGALGLEALSRGASHVTLVERDPKAAKVITRNAKMVAHAGGKQAGTFEVVPSTVNTFLARNRSLYGVVLIDPPYDLSNTEIELVLQTLLLQIFHDTIVVVERSARDPLFTPPRGYVIERTKEYGETVLVYLEHPRPPSHAKRG